MTISPQILVSALLSVAAAHATAEGVTLAWGGGPQNDSSQTNHATAIDYVFYDYQRSDTQTLSVGVSYNYLRTNSAPHRVIHAVSVFPQVLARAKPDSIFHQIAPDGSTPFVFARALGPSWMSDSRFGELRQEKFSFQAQLGAGLSFATRGGRNVRVAVAWKHFSNADLFGTNDGYDFPVTLSITFENY